MAIERPLPLWRSNQTASLQTIKVQLVICSLEVLLLVGRKGKAHHNRIFTESRLPIIAEIDQLVDSGYQALATKLQASSYAPIKKTRNQPLTGGRIPIQHATQRGQGFAWSKKPIEGNIEITVRDGMLLLDCQPQVLNPNISTGIAIRIL